MSVDPGSAAGNDHGRQVGALGVGPNRERSWERGGDKKLTNMTFVV